MSVCHSQNMKKLVKFLQANNCPKIIKKNLQFNLLLLTRKNNNRRKNRNLKVQGILKMVLKMEHKPNRLKNKRLKKIVNLCLSYSKNLLYSNRRKLLNRFRHNPSLNLNLKLNLNFNRNLSLSLKLNFIHSNSNSRSKRYFQDNQTKIK